MDKQSCERKKATLGVVAICKNEERDLPGFLENLLPWVDEIVLVDDGSTDQTVALANRAGNKVRIVVDARKDGEFFADQRNKGVALAQSDWLLHMDIDERVTAALRDEIQRAIQSEAFDAYHFRRLNYFLHRPMRGGGWQNWNQVHLAKRECLRFEGMFHERVVLNVQEERVGQLQSKMIHLNDASYEERMHKSLTYSTEQATRLKTRFRRIKWHHILMLPIFEFVRKYIAQRGFRDGVPGLIFAMHAAGAMFRACALVWDEQNYIAREELDDLWKGQ